MDEGQLVVVDDDRAAVAVHLQPGAEPRVRGRAGMQDTEGAVLEPDHTDGDVFDLDPFVGEGSGVGEDLDGAAHRGHQQVDGVHALIHQRSPAVELPGAAPVAGVVVRLPAPPVDRGDAAGQPAELTVADGRHRHLGRRVEPVLRDNRDLSTGAALSRDDLIGLRNRGLGGFLDDHVLACLQGLDGDLAVPAGWCADRHHVDVNGLQCIGQRGKRLAAMLRDQPLGSIAMGVDNSDEVDPVG